MNSQPQPVFSIEKIYVKDLSLEIPNAPRIFLERERREVNIQLHTKAERIDEGMFETVLTITVTAKIKDKTMFLVEVQAGGYFPDSQCARSGYGARARHRLSQCHLSLLA